MIKYLLLLSSVLSASGYTVQNGTNYLTDGSRIDTTNAIAHTVDGDTVTLSAGSFTWTSGVIISGKGIKLQGAGGGRIEGSSSSSITIGTGSKSFNIRTNSTITGFTGGETLTVRSKHVAANRMVGTVTSWNGITLVLNVSSVNGSGTSSNWVFEAAEATKITHNAGGSVLIDVTRDALHTVEICNMRLVEGTGSGYGIQVGGSGKPCLIHDLRISNIHTGIRDNNNGIIVWRFYADAGFNIGSDTLNNDNAIQVTKNYSSDDWYKTNTVGMKDYSGLNNVYIEDSYFIGLVLGCIDCGDNFRGALRHCVFDNSAITIHGQDTDDHGCRQLEVYNNLMIFNELPSPSAATANLNYWITWRGGSGIVVSNTMDDIDSWAWGNKNEINLEYQPLCRDAGSNACYAGPWPGPRQPGQGSSNSVYITEGVYVYGNTGTVVISRQNYDCNAIDGCGSGQDISTFIQLNRDYFTAAPAAGTPFSGYTRYTYPHPLTLGAQVTVPEAPRVYIDVMKVGTFISR